MSIKILTFALNVFGNEPIFFGVEFFDPDRLSLFQIGWQDCVSRLLIKRPIASAVVTADEATDLMTFEEDLLDVERVGSRSPSSVSRLSASVTDAAYVLENEIKGHYPWK